MTKILAIKKMLYNTPDTITYPYHIIQHKHKDRIKLKRKNETQNNMV